MAEAGKFPYSKPIIGDNARGPESGPLGKLKAAPFNNNSSKPAKSIMSLRFTPTGNGSGDDANKIVKLKVTSTSFKGGM